MGLIIFSKRISSIGTYHKIFLKLGADGFFLHAGLALAALAVVWLQVHFDISMKEKMYKKMVQSVTKSSRACDSLHVHITITNRS